MSEVNPDPVLGEFADAVRMNQSASILCCHWQVNLPLFLVAVSG